MAVPRVNLTTVRRKSGISYVLDYSVNGKRVRETVGRNKRTAELIASKRQIDLVHGQYGLIPDEIKIISVDDLISEFLSSKENIIRESSLKRYKSLLANFSEYFNQYFPATVGDIRNIKGKYIKECMDSMLNTGFNGKRWNPKTINLFRETVSAVFRYAKEEEYVEKNPVSVTNKYPESDKGGVQYFTDNELERIWGTIDEYWVDPLKFIVNTGLRSGEMANLQWEHVDLNGTPPSIKITSSSDWKTKTGNTRDVPLNAIAIDILNRRKGKHREYVFVSKRGNVINPRSPLQVLKTTLNKLGIEGDVHKLRHTFASNLVMAGESLYVVKELLGHADLKSTQIYAHLSKDHLKDAVDKLE